MMAKFPIESHQLIPILLGILCTLAALDLWRQMATKNELFWLNYYSKAIKSRYELWRLGYVTEDLEMKLGYQSKQLKQLMVLIDQNLAPKFSLSRGALRHNIHNIEFTRQARIDLHNMYRNDTSFHYIGCGKNGPRLRVGQNDYRTDPRDMCQIFVEPALNEGQDAVAGPQAMFEVLPLPGEAIALRSVANGLFLKVVPPPNDHSSLPWKVMAGGAVIGAAETFRVSAEGYLFSPLINGFISCSPGQMLCGITSSYGYYSAGSSFYLEHIPPEEIQKSYMLVDLSNQIKRIQGTAQPRRSSKARPTHENEEAVKICLAVPMTSKGTEMKEVVDSPFWTNLFDSFMKSIDWRSNKYVFRFYLGFDRADKFYDTGDAWSELREEFKHRATFRMVEQMMTEQDVDEVLSNKLSLKIMHFDHLEGAPSQVVSQLVLAAHSEGFDYFYQINDDTVIVSPNWPVKMIDALRSNTIMPNFGVTGPTDSTNEKIFTHSFTHRTHIDIFGHLFPTSFKNWWSDDWISTVYGAEHTFRSADVLIQHNVKAQKTGEWNRYQVDTSAQFRLGEELRKGHVQIDEWLKKHSLPRLPLPAVCGYIPSLRYIAPALPSTLTQLKI